MAALDEICCPAVYRAGPHGPARARSMLDEHAEVREIIGEARLQPAGSPPWRQLIAAALATWTSLPHREHRGLLDDLRQAEPPSASRSPASGAPSSPHSSATSTSRRRPGLRSIAPDRSPPTRLTR